MHLQEQVKVGLVEVLITLKRIIIIIIVVIIIKNNRFRIYFLELKQWHILPAIRKWGGWGESWVVWHMAAFCFLLDSTQCSDWQVFNGCIAACIKETTNRDTHHHRKLTLLTATRILNSVAPLCGRQQLNLITSTTKQFPLSFSLFVFLLLSPCLSHPFNFISCNVISAYFAQSRCHFS